MKTMMKVTAALGMVLLLVVLSAFQAAAVQPIIPKVAYSSNTGQKESELPPDIFDRPCPGGASCPGKVFRDMPGTNHWSHNPIDWAITRRITAGTSATTFSPGETCTRAQIVTFLWRAFGSQSPSVSTCPFTDVRTDAYYYRALLWAYGKRIVSGTTPTTFGPNKRCSRAQTVTFLWAAAGRPTPTQQVCPFRDVSTGAYYAQAVLWATQKGITAGVSPTEFNPTGACKRAQVVTFLYRMFQ